MRREPKSRPADAMDGPLSPPEVIGPRDGDLPAYLSNGLLGLRVREQPLQAGMMIVSGFAGEHPERRVEAAAAAPYPLAGDVALNGVWLSDQPSSVSGLRQAYDFATGELTTAFRYAAAGVTAEVTVLTFASRTVLEREAETVFAGGELRPAPDDFRFQVEPILLELDEVFPLEGHVGLGSDIEGEGAVVAEHGRHHEAVPERGPVLADIVQIDSDRPLLANGGSEPVKLRRLRAGRAQEPAVAAENLF